MKYDSLRKLDRNHSIIWYHTQFPGMSWAEIGSRFEITRQAAQAAYNRTVANDRARAALNPSQSGEGDVN